MHIPQNIQAWELCTDAIIYNIQAAGSQQAYIDLVNTGKYRLLHYSGDIDGAVPTIGTLGWITSLVDDGTWTISEDWHAWTLHNQVGGYIQRYESQNFTFATVHGAGHMAPQYKREPTYHLIFDWISGGTL